jgi:hypothetical protein
MVSSFGASILSVMFKGEEMTLNRLPTDQNTPNKAMFDP